jgi:ribonuclease P protein component
VGNAPTRNRLRRRLRAAMRAEASALPSGAYLLGAGSAAVTLSPRELRDGLRELLDAAGRSR